MQEFIRHIGPEVNVISVCQPTVPVLAAVSLMASRGEFTPRTMTMMGGPIDARKSPDRGQQPGDEQEPRMVRAQRDLPRAAELPGRNGRRVYPGFLQHTGFVAMNPDRHLSSHYDYFLDLVRGDDDSAESHRQFYDEYNAVLDMPAEYYLDTIKTVFQDFALVNGTWHVDGELVRPQDIKTTALLTIEGELDDISGAGQTRAAHDLCTGIASDAPVPLRRGRRRPLRHLLRPPLARAGPPRGERVHRRASAAARCAPRRTARAQARAKNRPAAAPPIIGSVTALADLADAPRRRAAANAVHALRLPRLPAYAEAIAAGEAAINQCPPGGAEGIARLAAITGRARHGAESSQRPSKARASWPSSTKPGASAARCASRPARSIASSARRR